jgi:hypothetical protein
MGCIQSTEKPNPYDSYWLHIARRSVVNFDQHDDSLKGIIIARVSPTNKSIPE